MNKLSQLSMKKKELLNQKLSNYLQEQSTNNIKKHGLKNGPLSFSQQRLWIMNQIEPNSTAYNIPTAYRITGSIKFDTLLKSINNIVSKHESLRTNFRNFESEPQQLIKDKLEMNIDYDDQRNYRDDIGELIENIYKEEANFSFNLEKGPLFKVKLLQIGENEFILYLTFHHIIADAWSIEIFIKELFNNYNDIDSGKKLGKEDLEIQYTDYSIWQNNQLNMGMYEKQLDYWKKKLNNPPSNIEFPLDKGMNDEKSYDGSEVKSNLNLEEFENIKNFAKENGVSVFMVIATAFKIMLNRYTDQEDILIGSPIANRGKKETHDLIGFFLNTLVLRTNISGDLTFLKMLDEVKITILSAIENQDIPFEKVIEATLPNRTNKKPFFDIMINYISRENEMKNDHLKYEPIEYKNPESKFLFTLYVCEKENGLEFKIVFQNTYLNENTMKTFIDQLVNLIEQAIANPMELINNFRLVERVSEKFIPDPTLPIELDLISTLPELFEEQVRLGLNKVAIKYDDTYKTYEQLSNDSNRLANFLINNNTNKGEPVVLYGNRSYQTIVGMLGIMKAGAILVNVDENLTKERKELLIVHSGAKRIIDINGKLERSKDYTIYHFEETQKKDLNSSIVDREVTGNDPAYIFFTSGSTGVPKGILGEHKGLAHFLNWQKNTFNIAAHDKGAQLTNLSFDVVMRDIFLPLISGATLCIPNQDKNGDFSYLLNWLKKEEITFFHSVPSILDAWNVDNTSKHYLDKLKWIFSAGEPLKDKLIYNWKNSFEGSYKFVNLYGPSETTLAKTYHVINQVEDGIQSVGKPIKNTQIFIMKKNVICGIGEVGEIVIRTPYITRGYINKENNEGKFILNPFNSKSEDIFYRTGDVGRITSEGLLQVKGRMDDQIKINGVRVHLSEISSIITNLKSVKSAIVVENKQSDNSQRSFLVAYIVLEKSMEKLDASYIKQQLRKLLPLSVVPEEIIQLDKIPLNPNGKVDKKALPELTVKNESEVVGFRNETERELLIIWKDILGKETIGVTQNFFEIGGESLKAFQIISRVRKKFSSNIDIQSLFNNPTIAELALIIEDPQNNIQHLTIGRSKRRNK
ncbi:hypothetical protein A6P54_02665 [Bacillus sp. MKU004]|nr:hypothetical protein A6P54_02665 [Bacillus sp. MKU004]